MADDQVKIDFKTTYDGKAAEQAAQGIKKVEDSAKKSAGGVSGLEDSLKKMNSRFELFNRAMSGFGLLGAIGGIVSAVMALKKRFDDAAEAARKIKLEKISKDNEAAVKGLASEYEALLKSIEAVNMAILRQRELEAARLKNKRDMEDVREDMKQQTELDKLDRKDPLYKEKAGEITARYQSEATERKSGREYEDLQVQMQAKGDEISNFRRTEMAQREAAEGKWAEYTRQQNQIEQLEKPVLTKQKAGYTAGGTGLGNYNYGNVVEDVAATKQNRAAAEKLREELPDLEKKAREHIARADEAGNQAVQAAQIAETISQAKSVSIARADSETSKSKSAREGAYHSTDVARIAYEKEQEEKRKRDAEEAAKKEGEAYNQKAIPHIMQAETAAQAAQQKVADARIAEKAAEEARAIKVKDFEESGSHNTTVFKRSLAPLDENVSRSRSGRESAEREAKAAVAALDQLLSAYGDGFKEMTAKMNRAVVQQKLDASGGQ